jgi:pilus assembly protein CpaD
MMQISKLLRASAALAALCLAACSTPITNGPEASFDPNTHFPVAVAPQMMTLRLPYDGRSSDLDQNTSAQVARFAADYLDHGSGAIAVSAPTRLREAPNDVADRLVELGVPRDRILVGNQDEPGALDSVKLTYIRYTAQAPACGDWSENEGFTAANTVSPNFGCATQHNIAAQIADPRDLVSPRPVTPDDAQRRLQVLQKYRKGETTITQKTQAQSGAISDVAGGGM